ncbi:hypothetical protein GGI21_001798, partial [Coemansia aciculifera]
MRELPDSSIDGVRFAALADMAISEAELFHFDAEERRAVIEHLSRPKEDNLEEAGRSIGLQYDTNGNPIVVASPIDDGSSAKDEPPLELAFAVPDGMSIPQLQRHFGIIESTAQFISSQPTDMA